MTKTELIEHLEMCDVPAGAQVYFSVPDEEEILEPNCLRVHTVMPEAAHDDDGTPFIRVSLCDPSFETPGEGQ